MIPYILHVSILIAAGFLFYKLLLKKLTFYALNRWILLSCLVVAFVLPLLPIPRQWSWQERIVRQPEVKPQVRATTPVIVPPAVVPAEGEVQPAVTPMSGTAVRKPDISPASAVTSTPVTMPPVDKADLFTRILPGLFYLYLFGVIVLGINMLRQMISLLVQGYRGPVTRDGRYRIITTASMHGPCSFGNIIFIHPHRYDPDTYHQILLHEKVHAGGWHTVDILLAELGIIFQWFNPFIWMFRREMENNLEFLTDRHVLQHPGIERSAYQLSLVKVAAPDLPLSITSNYNQSLLKRRIIMMNAQNSARHTAWKYLFLLPLFIFLAGILNRPALLAQSSKNRGHVPAVPAIPVVAAVQAPVVVAQTPGDPAPPPVPNVQPVTSPLPVIVPVPPIDTVKPSSRAGRMEGSWFITSYKQDDKDDKVRIELRDQDDDHQWNSSFSVPRSKLSLSGVGKVEFALTREAGTMHFSGQFDGEQGFGHYKFQPDANYLAHMQQKKIVVEEDELLSFFLVDIKKDYVDMLQANGFPGISKGHLISMAALGVDEGYIRGVREMGYADIAENHLITFKALKIDGAYLRRFPASTPPQDIITYKSLRIDSDYVASLKREGYTDISSREIVVLRSLNVTPEFIRGFHAIGYKDIPVENLLSLKSLRVTPEYVKGFQEVGLTEIPVQELNTLKSLGITPEYVKGFLALGYKDIAVHHLASLKSMGITPEFIKEFNAIGFKNIPLNQLTSLKAMGVTPSYVSKMKEKGFVSEDLNKYIRLKNAFD